MSEWRPGGGCCLCFNSHWVKRIKQLLPERERYPSLSGWISQQLAADSKRLSQQKHQALAAPAVLLSPTAHGGAGPGSPASGGRWIQAACVRAAAGQQRRSVAHARVSSCWRNTDIVRDAPMESICVQEKLKGNVKAGLCLCMLSLSPRPSFHQYSMPLVSSFHQYSIPLVFCTRLKSW